MIEHKQSHLSNMEEWRKWKQEGCLEARMSLIEHYLPLVDYVTSRMSNGLPRSIVKDDLTSFGTMGLFDAVNKFDPDRGLQFETYASWRIRGAVIDGLRQGDWVPRTVREKAKRLEEAFQALEQSHLRSVTEKEVCEYLNISEKEFHQMLQEVAVTTVCSLDDPVKDEDHESRISLLVDEKAANPESKVNEFYQKDMLAKAIEKLTEKERTVVSLFYYEDLSLSEIAEVMSLSPSRISQLHSKAILRLRGSLGRYKTQLMLDE